MASRALRLSAIAASFVGHALVVIPMLHLEPALRHVPEQVAGLLRSGTGFSLDRSVLVFIEEEGSAPEVDRPAPPALDSRGLMHLTLPRFVPTFPELSDIDDADGTANAAEPASIRGDDSAELLRRYLGQMRARIERAWEVSPERPRGQCRVVLSQDVGGEILAYQIAGCSLDASAQEALLAAVRRASPLAPPPDARLFLPQVTLDFGTDAQLPANAESVQGIDAGTKK